MKREGEEEEQEQEEDVSKIMRGRGRREIWGWYKLSNWTAERLTPPGWVSPLVSRRLSCSSAARLVRLLNVSPDSLEFSHRRPPTLVQDQLHSLRKTHQQHRHSSLSPSMKGCSFYRLFLFSRSAPVSWYHKPSWLASLQRGLKSWESGKELKLSIFRK